MRFYAPIAKIDAEQRMVWGYASTEARDDQGEVIRREAMEAALGDYMRFANIREMHQPSAVGKAKEAAVDDKGLYLGAKIVDSEAWDKVVEGVYQGFSVGGRVTARDPLDRSIITGLALTEISVVDRPANPEAVFDCWKSATTGDRTMADGLTQIWDCGEAGHRHLKKDDALGCIAKRANADPAQPAGDAALAKGGDDAGAADGAAAAALAAGDPAQQALDAGAAVLAQAAAALAKGGDAPGDGDKPYGDVEYADPGYQDDGKKRYPLDTERHIRAAWNYIHKPKNAGKYSAEQVDRIKARIIAAWKEKIDRDGPPEAESKAARGAALQKHLYDVGHVAQVILDLDFLADQLALEAAIEGDDSEMPAKLQAVIAELCGFLRALVAEETAEIVAGDEDMSMPPPPVFVAYAAHTADLRKALGGARLDAWLKKATPRHSPRDQALLDLGHYATEKCMKSDGALSEASRDHLGKALDAWKMAGANATQDTAGNPEHNAPGAPMPGEGAPHNATQNTAKRAAVDFVEAMAKRHGGHQVLMDAAHDAARALTDGDSCDAAKAAGRHDTETAAQIQRAHDHLAAAGANCLPGETAMALPAAKTAAADDLAKLADERNGALVKMVTELTGMLAKVSARVEDIARTPLPALTARPAGLTAIEKGADGAGVASAAPGAEDVVAALAAMSDRDRALTMIKAAQANPVRAVAVR